MTFTLVATDICFHWFGINIQFLTSYTRSRREGFCRKADLRNLAKFKGKQLCQSLFFDKVPGLSTFLPHLLKKSSMENFIFCAVTLKSFSDYTACEQAFHFKT